MNAKMKKLSLAVVGLVGFAAAGSAMAQCPATLQPPWTTVSQFGGGVAVSASGGLDASACKLNASITNSLSSVATVSDSTPANETRYRVQFLVNPASIATYSGSASVQLFTANSAAAFSGRNQIVGLYLTPGPAGAKRLQIVASCNTGPTFKCSTSTGDLIAGTNRIELDVTLGASGSVKYWLNAAAGTTEPAATGTLALTGGNAGWVGVKTAILGLTNANAGYRNSHAGSVLSFDTFDSRRQTYIGF
jgi:hypothetical protein